MALFSLRVTDKKKNKYKKRVWYTVRCFSSNFRWLMLWLSKTIQFCWVMVFLNIGEMCGHGLPVPFHLRNTFKHWWDRARTICAWAWKKSKQLWHTHTAYLYFIIMVSTVKRALIQKGLQWHYHTKTKKDFTVTLSFRSPSKVFVVPHLSPLLINQSGIDLQYIALFMPES